MSASSSAHLRRDRWPLNRANIGGEITRPLVRSRPIRLVLGVIVLILFVAGCDDSTDDSPAWQCSDDATPTLLASKLDDDDGDGNPIDEDFPDIDDEDDDIADHAWIQDRSGVYHLFFHSESLYHRAQIEHYATSDFRSLAYIGVALTVDPNGWDADALWAPHVVEHDGVYYMFYTGVTGWGPGAVQRIGLATSTDLVTWTRFPVNRCPGTTGVGCVDECDVPWTTWGEPIGNFNHQCRDPFVIWDASSQRWLMFATAKSTNTYGVVTVASSPDLVEWSGLGFIDATRRLANGTDAQVTGGQAENAFVVTHDGTRYLLFTDWQDPEDSVSVANPRTIAQFVTSSSLDIDASGSPNWIYRGYLPDPGVNAIEVVELGRPGLPWLMSQSIIGPRSGFTKKDRRKLRLMCVTWKGDAIETREWGLRVVGGTATILGNN
jgi:Glycosyl hydrolases family 43